MDIIHKIHVLSPELISIVFSTIIAFIAWLIKKLIEAPFEDSQKIFDKYFEKRTHVLSEILANLYFIAYFPENIEYKEQLQKVLLDGSKSAYISKKVFDNIVRIAIDETTYEELTLATIRIIEAELDKLISKVKDNNQFYYEYVCKNPIKRIFKVLKLFFMYLVASTLIFSLFLIVGYIIQKIVISIL